MISYHKGDLLKSGCDIICHQVNMQGIMGGGLALQIATKYPIVEREYENYCRIRHPIDLEANILSVHIGENKFIFNCFTQDINFNTNYKWVRKVFTRIRRQCACYWIIPDRPITIGVPYKYGCGIANGEWKKVLSIFNDIFNDYVCDKYIDFQIWEKENAER